VSLPRRAFLAASAVAASAPTLTAAAQAARRLAGADVLAAEGYQRLRGRKVGVLTNPTGVLESLAHIVDDMTAHGVRPVAAFGPEHGFRGTAQAGGSEGSYTDPHTGIPVYDAYNVTPEALAAMYRKVGVDTVVFDIANVGARFYTYTWTMYIAMQAAVSVGASFVVLDRPNPIGGQAFGPQLDPAYATLVGLKPIVQQPGMTVGELAGMFDAEFLPTDTGGRRLPSLDIVRAVGWHRSDLFEGQWIPPSPNMPTLDTALLYPGTCLFEGTTISAGRGTTRPFETIGAPGIDWRWAEELNALRLPGVLFRENYFVPTFNRYVGETCGGVQVHLTDRERVDAIRTAVAMIVTARHLYPDLFGWINDNWVDKLSGSDRLRRMVDAGAGVDEVTGAWSDELAAFRRKRVRYLLYL